MESREKPFHWGSCQYESAYDSYQFFLTLIDGMGVDKVLESLKITTSGPITREELEKAIYEDMREYEAIEEPLPPKVTIEEYFRYTKDEAWDLWSAYLHPSFFLKDYVQESEFPQEADEHLPIFNMLAQGENFFMGFACALLTHYYGVDQEAFMDYDT